MRSVQEKKEVVRLVNERMDQALEQTTDLVTVLREMLSVNLETTAKFLMIHDDSSGEVGESARVAVGMTHGLVEACMQVSQDGALLVEETKSKIEGIRKQVDQLESIVNKLV
ncbi:hypothetical protein HOP50_17g79140 [Chloropicon primus]|nr:hypothetical protein A3770_17p78880 [Chloropicon primus]UPR04572.1 hypothetical protein HOP50_17g79140 [Chloropicon primus]|eukprot:QDZ25370.1 hypothetical protein A3770_17p78880 [Chloropicon primus]